MARIAVNFALKGSNAQSKNEKWFCEDFRFDCCFSFNWWGIFALTSDSFEKEAPKIVIKDKAVWNLKESFPIEISDNLGIKSYSVALIENGNRIPLEAQQINAQDAMCVAKMQISLS